MKFTDLAHQIKLFLKFRFSLYKDKSDEEDIIESIRRGIEFKGTSVWILVFAIFLASIGLNVNSTAVIIGAMLVSPLMGPIMGVGLGLGIFDFDLVKSAAKNLAIMVSVSLTASTIYFLLSPLSMAQSELLSRTAPTIWDVLIAMFGGLAGIVAGSSKEKGNVLPGVAIATALMPPLCTAGFGLAQGDFYFFIGAFYLFCINAVFISVSTFVVVRLLKFSKVKYLDKPVELRIKRIITGIVLVTVLPSIFIAYLTVRKALFVQRAQDYIRKEFHFDRTLVFTRSVDYENDRIDIALFGEPISEDTIAQRKEHLRNYSLEGTSVQITQGIHDSTAIDVNRLKAGILTELYARDQKVLSTKDEALQSLQAKLEKIRKDTLPLSKIAQEMKVLNSNLQTLSIQKTISYNVQENSSDTIMTAYSTFKRRPSRSEARLLENWLKARTQADTLRLIIE